MITCAFWAERRRLNREVLIPDGERRLAEAGNFHNLRAAASGEGAYRGLIYQDSDLYKWLEAVGWELRNGPSGELERMARETVALIAAAQDRDGYIDTPFQVQGLQRWRNLAWEHELYCMGHMIQAAVALPSLEPVARRTADMLVRAFADAGLCGHPEIELALIELYRVTGERAYLELAGKFVDRRGHGWLQPAGFGSAYFQDRVPVREQTLIEGHAVRALYLNCAATDLYLETGEQALLDAMLAQYDDMVSAKMYVTGGLGADASQEAFGAAYDLPPDRAYAETCAAVASVMWNHRLLQATGEVRFADELERALYNGVLVGVALDESKYAYVNPLHVHDGDHSPRRHAWYDCACCPPNIMRTLASLQRYLDRGQYATGDYPWDGRIEVEQETELRVPAWCSSARLNGSPVAPGWVRGRGVLELDMPPRFIFPDPRIGAVRGCVAIARGPLIYCVEGEQIDRLRLTGELRLDGREIVAGVEGGEVRAIPYFMSANAGDLPMRVWIDQSSSRWSENAAQSPATASAPT
jgi:DUF1680 family protein